MDIGPYTISKKSQTIDFFIPRDIDEQYDKYLASGKRLILGTLIARSGTRWLCDIFTAHSNGTGVTERYADSEAFFRYVTSHKLPIDMTGVIQLIKKGIVDDWKENDIALVFSPYFSHGLELLINELKPEQTIIGLAEPRFTVQSIYNKGIFEEQLYYKDMTKVVGYQPQISGGLSHFFGRITPSGNDYKEWSSLTRVGKISWWANRIMQDIKAQMDVLSEHKFYIFNLPEADQNYDYYKKMAEHFRLDPLLRESNFLALKKITVKENDNLVHNWSDKEDSEFNKYSSDWFKIYNNLTTK